MQHSTFTYTQTTTTNATATTTTTSLSTSTTEQKGQQSANVVLQQIRQASTPLSYLQNTINPIPSLIPFLARMSLQPSVRSSSNTSLTASSNSSSSTSLRMTTWEYANPPPCDLFLKPLTIPSLTNSQQQCFLNIKEEFYNQLCTLKANLISQPTQENISHFASKVVVSIQWVASFILNGQTTKQIYRNDVYPLIQTVINATATLLFQMIDEKSLNELAKVKIDIKLVQKR